MTKAKQIDGAVIKSKEAAVRFMFAGNATFTLKSNKTDLHLTYKIVVSKDDRPHAKPVHFVYVLSGPNNSDDFTYVGMIKDLQAKGFELTAKSRFTAESRPVKAFIWYIDNLRRGGISEMVELFHMGKCGRCSRPLTVPASIHTGLGPDCAEKAGIPYGLRFKAERMF